MNRWRIVALGGGALFVGAGVVLALLRPAICEEPAISDEPEVIRRANELLELEAADRSAFLAEATEDFRRASASTSQDPALEVQLVNALNTPRMAQGVWRASQPSFAWLGSASQGFSICRVSPPYSDTLKFSDAAGDVAVVFFETEQEPLAQALTVQLRRQAGTWRVDAVAAQPSRDHGRHAQDFENLGDARVRSGADLDALLAYLAAARLSVRSSNVKTVEQDRIAEKLAHATEPSKKAKLFSRDRIPREDDFLDISVEVAREGLLPLISFVSSKEGEATRPDAQALFDAMATVAPSLRSDFPAVAMKAYPEHPVPGRRYNTFGTVIKAVSAQ
jgi:hypothetical protein